MKLCRNREGVKRRRRRGRRVFRDLGLLLVCLSSIALRLPSPPPFHFPRTQKCREIMRGTKMQIWVGVAVSIGNRRGRWGGRRTESVLVIFVSLPLPLIRGGEGNGGGVVQTVLSHFRALTLNVFPPTPASLKWP